MPSSSSSPSHFDKEIVITPTGPTVPQPRPMSSLGQRSGSRLEVVFAQAVVEEKESSSEAQNTAAAGFLTVKKLGLQAEENILDEEGDQKEEEVRGKIYDLNGTASLTGEVYLSSMSVGVT